MAPIRRYLRITKYSVLECRIYLDNPALAQSWLLNPREPALPRVIDSVRPLVLPKLREERERAKKKSTKKKAIRDVVVEDDFEVSIFLTETTTRHSLVVKHKHFRDRTQTKLKSNSGKLMGATDGSADDDADAGGNNVVDLDKEEDADAPQSLGGSAQGVRFAEPVILREDDSDGEGRVDLDALPDFVSGPSNSTEAIKIEDEDEEVALQPAARSSRTRRQRATSRQHPVEIGDSDDSDAPMADDALDGIAGEEAESGSEDGDELFVQSAQLPRDEDDEDSDSSLDVDAGPRPAKRLQRERQDDKTGPGDLNQAAEDDKKKLAMDISYQGFAIYGRVLCLVVRRREPQRGPFGASSSSSAARGGRPAAGGASSAVGKGVSKTTPAAASGSGQAVMENWISSTQMPVGAEDG